MSKRRTAMTAEAETEKKTAEKLLAARRSLFVWICAAVLCLAAVAATAQQTSASASLQAQSAPPQVAAPQTQAQPAGKISSKQTRQLSSIVDELLDFSSHETGLPIKSQVKRQVTSRAAVESYLKEKFDEDESARRMQRGEIVLKKFGLLDRDFALKPFLLELLGEQVEAYYDAKTKTVYLLDWVDVEEQKPVLAHELTHALQDQRCGLEKWNDQTPDDVSLDFAGDTDHIAKDEMDTAREAVVEGQATAVMMDYMLKPMGRSLVKDPEVMDFVKQQMSASEDSPVLARAPLLLSESLLFPYREGLSFEQDVWMDQGQAAAFAGALDRPPSSSWEIINPREYEKRHMPAVPLLPNIHPLVDPLYKPYDIGQMGQLDVRILTELFGGNQASRDLTPAWDGGLYWAGQRLSAKTAVEQASTNSIAIFYLSVWKNAASAQSFARLYAEELGRKYSGVKEMPAADLAAMPGDEEKAYSTSEGPAVITTRGKMVFVAESFPLELARKLTSLVLDSQGTGEMRLAQATHLGAPGPASETWEGENSDQAAAPSSCHHEQAQPVEGSAVLAFGAKMRDCETGSVKIGEPLTASLIRFLSHSGVMKTAVEAGIKAAAK